MRIKPGEIKVKFNLLTVKQLKKICDSNIKEHDCLYCPFLHDKRFCRIAFQIRNTVALDVRVNLNEKMASRMGIVPKIAETKRKMNNEN